MSSPDSVPSREAISPHPVLTGYYPDIASRQDRVNALFNASAAHYDWVNGMMSFGSGRWYRGSALRRHGLEPGMRVLDVGAGTGAVALLAQKRVGPTGDVVALDPSQGMLARARDAGVRRAVAGYGELLPFPDGTFDMLTMGYALRHVADLRTAFKEYRRVLRPGGKLLLLEITPPRGRVAHRLLRAYLRGAVPGMTRVLRRSRDAQTLMRYYWDTVESCVPPEVIVVALEGVGFAQSRREVVLGVFSEYAASRPLSP